MNVENIPFYYGSIKNNGTANLNDGIYEQTYIYNYGDLTVNGGNFTFSDYSSSIYNYEGGEVIINNASMSLERDTDNIYGNYTAIDNEGLLTVNNISGVTRIIYLLIYIFFYMIDDMVVFAISMITVEATGITNKYNKLCTLISAIIMIVIGLLLLLKPSWLMLNF